MGVKPNSPVLKDVETLPLPLLGSGCPCQCNPCGGEGLLQVPVLLHLPSCQFRLQHQLHLWRTLLEDDLDLRPDLPCPLGQRCWSIASTTSCTFGGLFWRTTLTCAQIFPVLAANQG